MPKQKVSFVAVETVKKPVRVKFKTRSGGAVYIKALRTVRKRKAIRSRTKKG